ncbi:GntR family transcriptional regulator [Alsobacter sp. R-9]
MSVVEDSSELIRTAVYHRLRSDILSCALRPGSQLQEKQLCERYGVSKSPIRDAMLKLEELSLVEIMPRKGYRVRPISLADARELYDLRLLLERECVSKAVESAPDATLAALDQFRNVDGAMPLADWIEYNRAFHGALADASGNSRLARMTRQVLDQFDRLTTMSVEQSGPGGRSRFVAEHGGLIDALQRRDKRQAVALSRDHAEGSRKRVFAALEALSVIP